TCEPPLVSRKPRSDPAPPSPPPCTRASREPIERNPGRVPRLAHEKPHEILRHRRRGVEQAGQGAGQLGLRTTLSRDRARLREHWRTAPHEAQLPDRLA